MSNRNTFLKIILWVFALEIIRNKYNNLERLAHQEEWDKSTLLKKQKTLLLAASLIYGIFISFVILNFLISLTQKITSVYPDTEFLKSNVALLSTVMLSYIVSVVVMRHGIQLYIKKINGLPAFCRRVGLKVWNSTKIVGQVPRKATEVIVGTDVHCASKVGA